MIYVILGLILGALAVIAGLILWTALSNRNF